MNLKIKKIDIVAIGAYAICAQSIFIREMLGFFSGTEFVVSILISSWLLWVGVGGVIGGRIFRGLFRNSYSSFQCLVVFTALIFPATILLIRFGRGSIVSAPGEMPPFLKSILFCVFAMAPSAFANGLIYNAASYWRRGRNGNISEGVTWVYIMEALGSVLGGLLFSLILLNFFTQFEISLIFSFILMLLILSPLKTGKGKAYRILFLIIIGLGFVIFYGKLDLYSINRLFPNFNIKGFGSSKYGEIVAIENNNAISYYSGGTRLFTVPDNQNAEEAVHIPLLAHNKPKRVLLVGGGLAGEIKEIYKHPSVEQLDCVQLDDYLIKMIGNREELKDSYATKDIRPWAVNIIVGDGRLYLKENKTKYDVIIVNAPDPLNLELNRYYTEEFFNIAKKSLKGGGIFSITHSSSENFISYYQSLVLGSIKRSLEGVFDSVSVFPGSKIHFICGDNKIGSDIIFNNLGKRNLDTKFINWDFLPFRLSDERMQFIASNIGDIKNVDVNRDLLPALTAYELFLEFSRKGYLISGWISKFSGKGKWLPVLAAALIITIIFFIPGKETAVKLDVWSVGFSSFLFQINVLLAYQSFSGYLYTGIVFLTAFFMAGISSGTWICYKVNFDLIKSPKFIHTAFILFSVLYVAWLLFVGKFNLGIISGSAGFISASFTVGIFTGIFYRVVVSSALEKMDNSQPSVFYSWDMFGACAGGLLGGIFIYPFSGSYGTIALFLYIHLLSLLLLSRRWVKAYLLSG